MDENVSTTRITDTKRFCTHLAGTTYGDLSERARQECRRGVLDWLGCALAGSVHPTITKLVTVLEKLGGKPCATVFGRNMKLGLLDAALANGQMGHILDFDDTHMGGVVLHTSSPVLSALFPLSEERVVDGRAFMLAYAVGLEAGVRTGQTAPLHHAGGWHLTGTLGSIAAGVAAGKLLGLDGQQLTYAMGISGTQAAGMQQNRGTMCKSFHAGKAASSGVLAALLAENGYDSSQEIVEGKRGFCRIYSTTAAPEKLLEGLGKSWEIERNGHKPYACGVVLHPLIDACIGARAKVGADVSKITEVALRVHPLVLSITGLTEPTTGLQTKFSVNHSAAVALIDGAAGRAQYTDAKALDPTIMTLRRKVTAVTDDKLRKDEAYAIVTVDGVKHEVHIPHASGTVDNPMSDAAIEAKFMANAEPVVGADRAREIVAFVRDLDAATDMSRLAALMA
jgi:2-methylcitrate dehydratase PrpD